MNGDACPECGHDDRTPRGPNWVERLLRLGPAPARCAARVEDVSGWGGECGCPAPFHGS